MGVALEGQAGLTGKTDFPSQGRPDAAKSKPVKVLLVDDHAIVREGLCAVLESSGEMECLEADSAEAAMNLLQRGTAVDVVVLDFSLPGADGLEAIMLLHQERVGLPVLLFSMQPEEMLAARALRLGAAGYISKSSRSAEVVEAVRLVAHGGRYVSREFAARVAAGVSSHQALSEREFEVLRMIGSGKSVTEIGALLGLSVKTVNTYRERLMEKLGLTSTYEIIRYVLEQGLLENQ